MRQIEFHQFQFTWWAEDGSERRGRVSLAPHASPNTVAALARMMRLNDPAEAKPRCKINALLWPDGPPEASGGPQEERD